MPRFRPRIHESVIGSPADLLAVGQVIDDAMQPGHFFAAPELHLAWIAARSETISWEIFRGRLLDASQTRLQKTFLSWHVIEETDANPAQEPMISVKLDVRERQIHVTRGLLTHAWEAYDAGAGVIESRAAVKWLRELVGSIALEEYADLESVRDELICLLWQAVVGTSRLPLTSVEAPLPAFVFGKFHYLYQAGSGESPVASWEEWLMRGLRTPCAWRETVKLAEFTLRHNPPAERDEDGATSALVRMNEIFRAERPLAAESMPRLVRALFNDVSLSPVTHFMDNAIVFGHSWWPDLETHLLRQLCRHLTAYDLVTFHHRGANYPDALLLDALLKKFDDANANSTLDRRALRQACLMRRHYEGHLVPDAPTSPGENARVLPPSHPRVAEEQLTQMNRRRRKLFAELPLSALLSGNLRQMLAESIRDLANLDERVEMGMGIFIDRPLGYAKEVGEPDLTPLLAHEALSPSIARRRWQELKKLCADLAIPCDSAALDALFENGPWPTGLPHAELAECPRPVTALADVRRVADDFVILRTLPGTLGAWAKLFDWRPLLDRYRLRFLAEGSWRWCAQVLDEKHEAVLALADANGRRRLHLRVDASQGYASRAGIEWPRAGLLAMRIWEDTDDPALLKEHDLLETPLRVPIVSIAETDRS